MGRITTKLYRTGICEFDSENREVRGKAVSIRRGIMQPTCNGVVQEKFVDTFLWRLVPLGSPKTS